MTTHFFDLIKAYADRAAITLLVLAIFIGLAATAFALPLVLVVAAGALALFRYWDDVKTLDRPTIEEWIQSRRAALSVRHWHSPHNAAEYFGNFDLVRTRKDASSEMNVLMMELIRKPVAATGILLAQSGLGPSAEHHARYESAQARYNQANAALAQEIHAQLLRGELIAKGLPMKDDVALSEHIIPTSRWRVLGLDINKAAASGEGLNYAGIVIGRKTKLVQRFRLAVGTPHRRGDPLH